MIKSVAIKQIYEGPNLFSKKPLIRVKVVLSESDLLSKEMDYRLILDFIDSKQPLFTKDWQAQLPSFSTFQDSSNTLDLLAHLTILFQRWLGYPVSEHLLVEDPTFAENDIHQDIAFEYSHPKNAIFAFNSAYDLVNELSKKPKDALGALKQLSEQGVLGQFLRFTKLNHTPGPWFIREASRRHIPWRMLGDMDELLEFGQGFKSRRVFRHMSGDTSAMSSHLSTNKFMAGKILRSHGLPVPEQKLVNSAEEALKVFNELGETVVIKPVSTDRGVGVFPGLETEKDVRTAFLEAKRYGKVLIEQHIPGDQHRIMVINGRYSSVRKQIPAHIIGDGKHSVRDLIDIENRERRESATQTIPTDKESADMLSRNNLTWDSVPEIEQRVFLRLQGNLATGGTVENIKGNIHPDNIIMAERAASVMNMDISGIDFITTDISQAFYESGGKFCEINNNPAFYFEEQKQLLAEWFPSEMSARIPVIAIIDPSPENQLGASIRDTLSAYLNKPVSYTNAQGVFVNRDLICRDDMSINKQIKMAMSEPKIGAAVLSLKPEQVYTSGIALDRISILLVPDNEAENSSMSNSENRLKAIQILSDISDSSIQYAKDAMIRSEFPLGPSPLKENDTVEGPSVDESASNTASELINTLHQWIEKNLNIDGISL